MPVKLSDHANERATYVVTVSFTDESGAAVVPTAATWTLTDRAGAVINSHSNVTINPLSSTYNIVLSGADLALPDIRFRHRLVTVQWTYNSSLGTGLFGKEEIGFYIDPLRAVA